MTRTSIHTLASSVFAALPFTTAAALSTAQSTEELWLDRLFGLDELEGSPLNESTA